MNDISFQTENGMKFTKKIVRGDTIIQLKHQSTGGILMCEKIYEYNHNNCPRCPIIGQLEVTS